MRTCYNNLNEMKSGRFTTHEIANSIETDYNKLLQTGSMIYNNKM